MINKENIELYTVKEGEFIDYINVSGHIAPGKSIYVESYEEGRISEIFTQAGNVLKKGDRIAKLINTDLDEELSIKKAKIEEKRNELENALLDLDRTDIKNRETLFDFKHDFEIQESDYSIKKRLFKIGGIPKSDFIEIETKYLYLVGKQMFLTETLQIDRKLKEKKIEQIRLSLTLLELEKKTIESKIENLMIRAAVTGQLTDFEIVVGETIKAGGRIAQIDLTERLKIRAKIAEYYLARINVGNHGSFRMDDAEYIAVVSRISPQVRDGIFDVDFVIKDRIPVKPRIGQSVNIKLSLGDEIIESTLLLMKGPFCETSGGNWVYLLDQEGKKALKKDIRIGKQNTRFFEILGGLNKGDRVIISSYEPYKEIDTLTLSSNQRKNMRDVIKVFNFLE